MRRAVLLAFVLLLASAAAAHAQEQARVRPVTFTPTVRASADSDGNLVLRAEVAAALAAGSGLSFGVAGAHMQVGDGAVDARGLEGAVTGEWRPVRSLRMELRAGAVSINGADAAVTTEGVPRARVRWRPERGPALDVRARHEPLMATPELFSTPVVLSETRAVLELPMAGPLYARGHVRHGRLREAVESNTRTAVGAGPVLRLTKLLELNASGTRTTYARPSSAGYFAPERVDAVDAGMYVEHYGWWPMSVALDVGAGAERVTRFGEPTGGWQRALRLWAQLSRELGSTGELRLELEAYESRSGEVPAAGPGAWRWGSLALSAHLRP